MTPAKLALDVVYDNNEGVRYDPQSVGETQSLSIHSFTYCRTLNVTLGFAMYRLLSLLREVDSG